MDDPPVTKPSKSRTEPKGASQENAKHRHRILGCWSKMGMLVLAFALLQGGCCAYYLLAFRCPSVSGIVVDMTTERPIPGVQVMRNIKIYSRNPIRALGATSGPHDLLPESFIETGRDGTFQFHKESPPLAGLAWDWFFIPHKAGMRLVAYSDDYLLVDSSEEGFDWTDQQHGVIHLRDRRSGWRPSDPVTSHVTRQGSFWRGYEYRIEMTKATAQEQWRLKCDQLLNYGVTSKEPWTTWRFNSLTGYLDRWPEGNDAWRFLGLSLRTGHLASCDLLQDEVARGDLTHEDLTVFCARNKKILQLAARVSTPRQLVTLEDKQRAVELNIDLPATVKCMEDLLEQQKSLGRSIR